MNRVRCGGMTRAVITRRWAGEVAQLTATGVRMNRIHSGDDARTPTCGDSRGCAGGAPRKIPHRRVAIDSMPSMADLLCMARQSEFIHSIQTAELETIETVNG